MKLTFLIAASILIAPSGIAPTQAAQSDTVIALAGLCQPGLKAACSGAVCASVAKAEQWPKEQQVALGAYASQLVNDEGRLNPGAAQSIAGCVVNGPKAVADTFDARGGVAVDIGASSSASPE